MNVTNDGDFACWLKVLASVRMSVPARRDRAWCQHFVFFFAEAEHQAGFGGDIGMGLFGAMKQFSERS